MKDNNSINSSAQPNSSFTPKIQLSQTQWVIGLVLYFSYELSTQDDPNNFVKNILAPAAMILSTGYMCYEQGLLMKTPSTFFNKGAKFVQDALVTKSEARAEANAPGSR